jgi:hypothetical protein
MSGLKNPTQPGKFKLDQVIYASSGLNYSAVPDLVQYQAFDSPHPSYVTGRLDIAAFGDLGSATPWPFGNTNVPINGHICIPRGRGPFPLAVFVHGNHDPLENSTPGYLYLCELLASHGIIAPSTRISSTVSTSAKTTLGPSFTSSTSNNSGSGTGPSAIRCTGRSTSTAS